MTIIAGQFEFFFVSNVRSESIQTVPYFTAIVYFIAAEYAEYRTAELLCGARMTNSIYFLFTFPFVFNFISIQGRAVWREKLLKNSKIGAIWVPFRPEHLSKPTLSQ